MLQTVCDSLTGAGMTFFVPSSQKTTVLGLQNSWEFAIKSLIWECRILHRPMQNEHWIQWRDFVMALTVMGPKEFAPCIVSFAMVQKTLLHPRLLPERLRLLEKQRPLLLCWGVMLERISQAGVTLCNPIRMWRKDAINPQSLLLILRR